MKKFKLFKYKKIEDFRTVEHSFQLFHFKRWSLIQFSLSYNEVPTFINLILMMGFNQLITFDISIYKFTFCIELITRNWHCFDD